MKTKLYYKNQHNPPSIILIWILTIIFIGFIIGMTAAHNCETHDDLTTRIITSLTEPSPEAKCAALDLSCQNNLLGSGFILFFVGTILFFVGIGIILGMPFAGFASLSLPLTILYLIGITDYCFNLNLYQKIIDKIKEVEKE